MTELWIVCLVGVVFSALLICLSWCFLSIGYKYGCFVREKLVQRGYTPITQNPDPKETSFGPGGGRTWIDKNDDDEYALCHPTEQSKSLSDFVSRQAEEAKQ